MATASSTWQGRSRRSSPRELGFTVAPLPYHDLHDTEPEPFGGADLLSELAAQTSGTEWARTLDGQVAVTFALGLVAAHFAAVVAAVVYRRRRQPLHPGHVLWSVASSLLFLALVTHQGRMLVDPGTWRHLAGVPLALWSAGALVCPTVVLVRAVVPVSSSELPPSPTRRIWT